MELNDIFWEVSEVLLSLQTKMSECIVVCRQNWKKCLFSQAQVGASWKKIKSGSLLVMSKQLAGYCLWSRFSPLWEAVKEHQSTKIPVQVIRPPWCTKFLLLGTNFALSDCVNPSKASVSYLLWSYFLVDFFHVDHYRSY